MASIHFDESCNLIGQFEVRIYKTEQNSENTKQNVNCCKNERRQKNRANKFYYLRNDSSILKIV